MPDKIKEVSVFFPTYNEEGNIAETVRKAKIELQKITGKWEILIINDGSKDRTEKIASDLARGDKQVRLINHKVNKGYGGALKTGFTKSKYPWIVFTDSDGQFDFSEISNFFSRQKQTGA